MTKFISFLTSKELLIACGVIGIAILLCLVIYYVEKSTEKRRRRHNTRELNKLVEEVKKEVPEEDTKVYYKEPVMEPIINEASSVSEMLEKTIEVKPIEEKQVEEKVEEPLIIEEMELVFEDDELEYTTIEPDQKTAQLELQKIRDELKKQESIEDTQNISLTNYEEEQEENAIISLEELVRKGKELYDSNEEIQYMDEGNVPISLQELEQKVGRKAENDFNEPFIIANVVPKEEIIEVNEEVIEPISTKKVEVNHKFQTSPIISPIYGIEKNNSINDLALENTANYEKLDAEIRRTNEFMMTMKELQNKLE